MGIFAFGYTLADLVSLLFSNDFILTHILRIKREDPNYPNVKGYLIRGKFINHVATAIIDLFILIVLILGD